jgi:hypothetical protein
MTKSSKEKEVNLFTFLNQIQNKRRTVPYDKKIANAYMLSQWLSHDKALLGKVNKINQYQFLLPDEVIYEYYMDSIPAGKRYIKWVKKRKEDDKLKQRIEKLQEHNPNLSIRECKMIITYLMNKRR